MLWGLFASLGCAACHGHQRVPSAGTRAPQARGRRCQGNEGLPCRMALCMACCVWRDSWWKLQLLLAIGVRLVVPGGWPKSAHLELPRQHADPIL